MKRFYLKSFLFILSLLLPAITCAMNLELKNIEPIQVGKVQIWPITDAEVTMEKSLLPNLSSRPEFAAAFDNGPLPAVDNTYLADLGDKLVLIDTGWGENGRIQGATLSVLKENNISPDAIKDILLTHMDVDHIGALLKNDERVFPNAKLWISKPEFEAWASGEIKNRNEQAKSKAKKILEKYDGQISLFNFGEEILPGITALDASGHTPGHTAFEIVSGNDKMLIAGDAIHIWQIQLPAPELSTIYDVDREKAAQTRKRLLNKAASDKSLFSGMHFPMISTVIKNESGEFLMRTPR